MSDFDKVLKFGNLYKGLKDSCRNVRWKDSVIGYESNALKNTYLLKKDILNESYKIQPYQVFEIHEPKTRSIVATRIRDRQFQHSMVDNVVYDQIVDSFISDNPACLKGRGVDYCLKRLTKHLSSYYRNHGCEGWVYKADIKNYFGSIPHSKIKHLIRRNIADRNIQNELIRIVDSYDGDYGLGLGSQVNQLLALLLLNDLDHFIKEKLQIKYYIRYMDDIRIIHNDKDYIEYCAFEIEKRINDLGLLLNENKTGLVPLQQGFEMLKWKFMLKPSGRVICRMRREKVLKEKKKLDKLLDKELSGELEQGTADQSIQSFMANARRGDTFSERREVAEYYRKRTGKRFHDYVKPREKSGST